MSDPTPTHTLLVSRGLYAALAHEIDPAHARPASLTRAQLARARATIRDLTPPPGDGAIPIPVCLDDLAWMERLLLVVTLASWAPKVASEAQSLNALVHAERDRSPVDLLARLDGAPRLMLAAGFARAFPEPA